jgi:hypothetical protein
MNGRNISAMQPECPWVFRAPVFKGNMLPGGMPDADEEKGKEKETLSERG